MRTLRFHRRRKCSDHLWLPFHFLSGYRSFMNSRDHSCKRPTDTADPEAEEQEEQEAQEVQEAKEEQEAQEAQEAVVALVVLVGYGSTTRQRLLKTRAFA
ncbi:unnamed protein product [Closterium sp. NIES-53]